MEIGQIVKIVNNCGNWDTPAYKNFERGEQRFYKIKACIRGNYYCHLVGLDGVRRSSWYYYLNTKDVVEANYKSKPLLDWA